MMSGQRDLSMMCPKYCQHDANIGTTNDRNLKAYYPSSMTGKFGTNRIYTKRNQNFAH